MRVMNIATSTELGRIRCFNAEMPKTDKCLLVTGLGHCNPKWLPLVSANMQQASENGMLHRYTHIHIYTHIHTHTTVPQDS